MTPLESILKRYFDYLVEDEEERKKVLVRDAVKEIEDIFKIVVHGTNGGGGR